MRSITSGFCGRSIWCSSKSASQLLQLGNFAKDDQKWDRSEDAEAAVDQAPGQRDATDGAGDQCQQKHSTASDNSELHNPFVTDGVNEWPDESYSQHKVREGEPVGAVGKEWGADAVVEQCLVDAIDPETDAVRKDRVCGKERRELASFHY